jgi:hypothetical protein
MFDENLFLKAPQIVKKIYVEEEIANEYLSPNYAVISMLKEREFYVPGLFANLK